MKTLLLTCLVLLAAGVVCAQPAGKWLFGATGRGTARWTEDVAGLTYRGGADFGWAVLSASSFRDGFVQARFKPISGREDQAGGLVWRWHDADNYYVDGKRLFTVRDDTFREAGKIGVWSKADSTTEFETPQFGDKS